MSSVSISKAGTLPNPIPVSALVLVTLLYSSHTSLRPHFSPFPENFSAGTGEYCHRKQNQTVSGLIKQRAPRCPDQESSTWALNRTTAAQDTAVLGKGEPYCTGKGTSREQEG